MAPDTPYSKVFGLSCRYIVVKVKKTTPKGVVFLFARNFDDLEIKRRDLYRIWEYLWLIIYYFDNIRFSTIIVFIMLV